MVQKQKKNFFKRTDTFFDKLEDGVRGYLSRRPILYTFIGGVGIVLFWRGVWHTADLFPFLTGPVSIIVSVLILLITGLFVSYFVGDMIIISGLKRDKKQSEKNEEEIRKEEVIVGRIEQKLDELTDKIDELEHSVDTRSTVPNVDTKTPHLL